MKTICNYHKLLIKFNKIMNSQFSDEKKQCEEFLNICYIDKETFIELIDFFYFSNKYNLLNQVKIEIFKDQKFCMII